MTFLPHADLLDWSRWRMLWSGSTRATASAKSTCSWQKISRPPVRNSDVQVLILCRPSRVSSSNVDDLISVCSLGFAGSLSLGVVSQHCFSRFCRGIHTSCAARCTVFYNVRPASGFKTKQQGGKRKIDTTAHPSGRKTRQQQRIDRLSKRRAQKAVYSAIFSAEHSKSF